MKEITTTTQEEEAAPPRLSFCDLPIPNNLPSPIAESGQPDNLFEFVVPPPPPPSRSRSRYNVVILFGKFILTEEEEEDQKRNYFATSKAKSFSGVVEKRRVNFSSLTSMSAKSRRRMFMSGPVKFRPEMDLAAIKQRQHAAKPPPPPPLPPSGRRKSRWELVKSSFVPTAVLAAFRCRREVAK